MTPGPWYLETLDHGNTGERDYIVRGAKGSAGNPNLGPWIATLNEYRTARDGLGDAMLIVATPDLLAAAAELVAAFDADARDYDLPSYVETLRAAILKARGGA